jgi:hypothetical protein
MNPPGRRIQLDYEAPRDRRGWLRENRRVVALALLVGLAVTYFGRAFDYSPGVARNPTVATRPSSNTPNTAAPTTKP